MTTTFNDAALEACYKVAGTNRRPVDKLVQLVNYKIDEAYGALKQGVVVPTDGKWFVQIGLLAHELSEALGFRHDHVALADMMCRKQADYGPQNILRRGPLGVIVRMTDKIARIENLLEKQAKPTNESLEDSVLDLQVYCAIGIMLIQNQFELPLDELAIKRQVKSTKLEEFFRGGFTPTDDPDLWINRGQ